MYKSVWGNTLDKSETWMFINKEPTDVCLWERHIRCVITHLEEGYNKYKEHKLYPQYNLYCVVKYNLKSFKYYNVDCSDLSDFAIFENFLPKQM